MKNLEEQYSKASKVAEDAYQLAKKYADVEKNSYMEAAISAQKAANAKFFESKGRTREISRDCSRCSTDKI
jgi:hypothetical protein